MTDDQYMRLETKNGDLTFRGITTQDDFARALSSLSFERGFEAVMSTIFLMASGSDDPDSLHDAIDNMTSDEFDRYMGVVIQTPLPESHTYELAFTLTNGTRFELDASPTEQTYGGLIRLIFKACTTKSANGILAIDPEEFHDVFGA